MKGLTCMKIVKRPPLTNRTGRIVIEDRAMREKPEACWECPVANEYTMCMLSSKVYEDLDQQYADCPLMEMEVVLRDRKRGEGDE